MNTQSPNAIAGAILGVSIAAAFTILVVSGSLGGVSNKPGYKEFDIVMKYNAYSPSTITVNLNDSVVLNFTNEDTVGHAVGIPAFNATIPGGHLQPGKSATLKFIANKRIKVDAATCGGPDPSDKTDAHGEELILNVI